MIQCGDCTGAVGRRGPSSEVGATKVASLGYGDRARTPRCAPTTSPRSVELYSDDIGGAEIVYVNDELAYGLGGGIGPEVTAMKEAGRGLHHHLHGPERA